MRLWQAVQPQPDKHGEHVDSLAPPGTIYVCGECGKTSPTRGGNRDSDDGWDVSCMLHAVLCHVKEDGDEQD